MLSSITTKSSLRGVCNFQKIPPSVQVNTLSRHHLRGLLDGLLYARCKEATSRSGIFLSELEEFTSNGFKLHSAVQDLNCPGCSKRFDRLGGLISHIELTECQAISKRIFNEAVRGKAAWDQNSREAHNFQGSRGGSSAAGDGPNPFAKSAAGLSADSFRPAQAIKPAQSKPVTYMEDNLISFDEPSVILNSGWGQSLSAAPFLSKDDFPALDAATAPESKGRNIAPFAAVHSRTAPENLSERVAAVNLSPGLAADPHDPNAPGFKIEKYWIPFIRKYKCPYLGCKYVPCLHLQFYL